MKSKYSISIYVSITLVACSILLSGCKKFIAVDAPVTGTNAGNVYESDATAISVLTGLYAALSFDDSNFSGQGGIASLSLFPGLSADEITLFEASNDEMYLSYYQNRINSSKLGLSDYYSTFYTILFSLNSAIEGLGESSGLTPAVKNQLLGEAHFLRGFAYSYLVNLYGEVPLVLTTDYKVSAELGRASTSEIYTQIKKDLVLAQTLLSDSYLDATLLKPVEQRIRPNKATAAALLSRVYLYTAEYANAEVEASKIIENTSAYSMLPLNEVFLKDSKETIWSLQSVNTGDRSNTGSGRIFILPATGPSAQSYPFYLNRDLVESFEAADLRLSNWINSVTVSGITYNFAYKYKMGALGTSNQENTIVFRLGEQYLIRAEARAQQNKILGSNSAESDLNVIRNRAGLNGTTALSKQDMLTAILNERHHELFTEWGHRWFDLKRTNTIDAVMQTAAIAKGTTWDHRWSLYPIPFEVIQRTPNLVQNLGYE